VEILIVATISTCAPGSGPYDQIIIDVPGFSAILPGATGRETSAFVAFRTISFVQNGGVRPRRGLRVNLGAGQQEQRNMPCRGVESDNRR